MLVSIVLGAVIIVVGLQFRSSIDSAKDAIVGGILIVTGIAFAVLELTGHGHRHDHGTHDHDHEPRPRMPTTGDGDHAHRPARHAERRGGSDGLAAVMVPFGAAASPDLTILPVFVAATAAGVATAVGSLVIFAAVTIGTIVVLTLVATLGGYQVRGNWLERWGNAFTALVLVAIGALVLAGVI